MAPTSQAHKLAATHFKVRLPAFMQDNRQVSGDILDTIDGALKDYSVSREAMRWNPGAGDVEAQCRNSADFSLAMLPPLVPRGHLRIEPHAVTPAMAWVREGHTIAYGDEMLRVTRRVDDEDGGLTFDVVPLTAVSSPA